MIVIKKGDELFCSIEIDLPEGEKYCHHCDLDDNDCDGECTSINNAKTVFKRLQEGDTMIEEHSIVIGESKDLEWYEEIEEDERNDELEQDDETD